MYTRPEETLLLQENRSKSWSFGRKIKWLGLVLALTALVAISANRAVSNSNDVGKEMAPVAVGEPEQEDFKTLEEFKTPEVKVYDIKSNQKNSVSEESQLGEPGDLNEDDNTELNVAVGPPNQKTRLEHRKVCAYALAKNGVFKRTNGKWSHVCRLVEDDTDNSATLDEVIAEIKLVDATTKKANGQFKDTVCKPGIDSTGFNAEKYEKDLKQKIKFACYGACFDELRFTNVCDDVGKAADAAKKKEVVDKATNEWWSCPKAYPSDGTNFKEDQNTPRSINWGQKLIADCDEGRATKPRRCPRNWYSPGKLFARDGTGKFRPAVADDLKIFTWIKESDRAKMIDDFKDPAFSTGGCFNVISQKTTWDMARYECRKRGLGDLATFESKQELHNVAISFGLRAKDIDLDFGQLKPMLGYLATENRGNEFLGVDGRKMSGPAEGVDFSNVIFGRVESTNEDNLKAIVEKTSLETTAKKDREAERRVERVPLLRIHGKEGAFAKYDGFIQKPYDTFVEKTWSNWRNQGKLAKRNDKRAFICRINVADWENRQESHVYGSGRKRLCEYLQDNIEKYTECMGQAIRTVALASNRIVYSTLQGQDEAKGGCCTADPALTTPKCPYGRGDSHRNPFMTPSNIDSTEVAYCPQQGRKNAKMLKTLETVGEVGRICAPFTDGISLDTEILCYKVCVNLDSNGCKYFAFDKDNKHCYIWDKAAAAACPVPLPTTGPKQQAVPGTQMKKMEWVPTENICEKKKAIDLGTQVATLLTNGLLGSVATAATIVGTATAIAEIAGGASLAGLLTGNPVGFFVGLGAGVTALVASVIIAVVAYQLAQSGTTSVLKGDILDPKSTPECRFYGEQGDELWPAGMTTMVRHLLGCDLASEVRQVRQFEDIKIGIVNWDFMQSPDDQASLALDATAASVEGGAMIAAEAGALGGLGAAGAIGFVGGGVFTFLATSAISTYQIYSSAKRISTLYNKENAKCVTADPYPAASVLEPLTGYDTSEVCKVKWFTGKTFMSPEQLFKWIPSASAPAVSAPGGGASAGGASSGGASAAAPADPAYRDMQGFLSFRVIGALCKMIVCDAAKHKTLPSPLTDDCQTFKRGNWILTDPTLFSDKDDAENLMKRKCEANPIPERLQDAEVQKSHDNCHASAVTTEANKFKAWTDSTAFKFQLEQIQP